MSATAADRTSLTEWPDLAAAPGGVRAGLGRLVAQRLFLGAIERLDVTVHLAGRALGRGGPVATVVHPDEFFARLGRDGLIGFGEAYLTGAWEADDLAGFLTVLAAELPLLVPRPLQRLRAAYVRRPPRHEENSTANTRDNIAHHYDLSNDLFETFLDETWSYSSALYTTSCGPGSGGSGVHLQASPPEATDTQQSLSTAQARKVDRLLDRTGVRAGSQVLEIGCGWGELAIRAARRGARVHAITLSSEQRDLALRRVAAAGVADRVEISLCDYRTVTGSYDVVLSVEMIEAVGHAYWPAYFATLDRRLAPGGRVGLQAITMPHERMLATRRTWTWINKYIFPGGFLPSIEAIEEVTRAHTALRLVERLSFGQHYAETLRRWDAAFVAGRDRVRSLGFDDTFLRMWHFYLCYSRAGFASGYLDVQQLVLARPGDAR